MITAVDDWGKKKADRGAGSGQSREEAKAGRR